VWSLSLITPPTALALTEDQAKAHSRIDPSVTVDDVAIKVAAAIAACEGFTARQLITATWELWLSSWYEPEIYQPSNCGDPGVIWLPKPPAQSITSVKYLNGSGIDVTMGASEYVLVAGSGPLAQRAGLFPAYGTAWPTNRAQAASIKIRFVAGYGASHTTVPPELTQGMLLWFGELYERREEQTTGAAIAHNSIGAERLWWPFRADF
jgi:uncharacterized phiE125 gp8 family phage protein